MTAPLTKRQKQVLDAIAAFIKEHGYSPSYEEIGALLGISSLSTTFGLLARLEKKGYIAREQKYSVRSISIVPRQLRALKSCENGHAVCWFAGDCPACGIKGAA